MEDVAAEIVLFPETDEIAPLVREKAIEIEYTLLELDESTRKVKFCLKADEVFEQLQTSAEAGAGAYTQELGGFQIESKPAKPFDSSAKSLLSVEQDMVARRAAIAARLGRPGNNALLPFTITTFPRFGTHSDVLASLTTSPALLAAPSRYRAVQHHITTRRRGATIPPITVPLFLDRNTFSSPDALPPFIVPTSVEGDGSSSNSGANITFHPSEMLLGATQCCLQCTLQAASASAALRLHDRALAPLGPLMLALSAAAPAYRGYLADTDVRWDVLRQLVDDRDEGERRAQGRYGARYGVGEVWLTELGLGGEEGEKEEEGWGLEGLRVDEGVVGRLVRGGVEEGVARYYAGALGRPLFVYLRAFADALREDADGGEGGEMRGGGGGKVPPNANFEAMHKAFFPHVKLKHPTAEGEGWRVEFRPMDVQLSDFENAAYVVFVVLAARAVERFGVDWRVPLGKVWENFDRAHPRDAVRWQRFWWRVGDGGDDRVNGVEGKRPNVALLTADEIVNGCQSFKGILALVEDYMTEEGFTLEEQEQLRPYLDLVGGRASGRLRTAARFIRDFVMQHPEYARDSQITEGICFDLLQEIRRMVDGKRGNAMFT
ncbi:Glutamate-cysteine ligase [Lasiodiplodia theobromae]|uniref:Glutamate-cysteine ligase n=1 Tax=Lasiodiplodia theobromae TaxID=45133 RepID=UPI0015C3DAFA|nr:Glutamate-cysteine ligase [Lasiodiplodia theobromae]KAF4537501.1 Glutamate-cysteine ligase [Lasiodiplodia theobromae]